MDLVNQEATPPHEQFVFWRSCFGISIRLLPPECIGSCRKVVVRGDATVCFACRISIEFVGVGNRDQCYLLSCDLLDHRSVTRLQLCRAWSVTHVMFAKVRHAAQTCLKGSHTINVAMRVVQRSVLDDSRALHPS